MRIVYDDAKQSRFVAELLPDFLKCFSRGSKELKDITRYDYGMDRIQSHLLKEKLNKYLSKYDFSVGDTVEHAHGIGNNCKYPVYYMADSTELQICCYISINTSTFSEVYVSCCDYNGKRLGPLYDIGLYGAKES